MAKIAVLKDGTQIHFPDDAPDEHMDQTVLRHMGVDQPRPDMMNALLQTLNAHTAAMVKEKEAPKPDVLQQLLQAIHSHVQALSTHAAAVVPDTTEANFIAHQQGEQHLGALREHTAATGNGFNGVIQSLAQLAENSNHITDLITAISQLSMTVLEVGQAVIAALQLPKEIYNDEKGVPKGIITKNNRKV